MLTLKEVLLFCVFKLKGFYNMFLYIVFSIYMRK